jgi:uncharacterized protein YjbI with pentapeptide repeats
MYTAGQLEALKSRWTGHRDGLNKLIPLLKQDKNWHQSATYQELLKAKGPLPEGVEEVERDLRGINLDEMDLSGANLEEADLSGANLVGAKLIGADLREARLSGAYLWNADLSGSNLWESDLTGADLRYADLSDANLMEADLSGANLWDADLAGANLEKANLANANVEGVLYTTDEVFDRLRRWWFPRLLGRKRTGTTRFDHLDINGVDFSRNALLKRYIEDYQYIQAVKNKHWGFRWILYPVWKLTSDCGRSLSVWVLWATIIIAGFGLLFSWSFYPEQVPTLVRELLGWAIPKVDIEHEKYYRGFWTPYYFSLGTFTNSSFHEDAFLLDNAAFFWVSLETMIGYLMLGGLIALFASRLAQRAG